MQTPPADEWERAAPHLPCRLLKGLLYVELQYHVLLLCGFAFYDADAYGLLLGGWVIMCYPVFALLSIVGASLVLCCPIGRPLSTLRCSLCLITTAGILSLVTFPIFLYFTFAMHVGALFGGGCADDDPDCYSSGLSIASQPEDEIAEELRACFFWWIYCGLTALTGAARVVIACCANSSAGAVALALAGTDGSVQVPSDGSSAHRTVWSTTAVLLPLGGSLNTCRRRSSKRKRGPGSVPLRWHRFPDLSRFNRREDLERSRGVHKIDPPTQKPP